MPDDTMETPETNPAESPAPKKIIEKLVRQRWIGADLWTIEGKAYRTGDLLDPSIPEDQIIFFTQLGSVREE